MVRRSARVPLYEYMQTGSDRAARAVGERRASGAAPPLQPGRAVRIPAGLLLVGVGLALILILSAYVLGSWRGRSVAESAYREQLIRYGIAMDGSGMGDRARDPMGDALGEGDSEDRSSSERREPSDASGGSTPPPLVPFHQRSEEDGAGSTPRAGASERPSGASDPIRPGLHYLVIMETNADGAQRLVEFCRSHGLDAHAFRRHNAGNFFVVMLPGFESTSDPGFRHLRDVEVARIGRIWRTLDPGRSDFSDAYPLVLKR